MYDKEIRGFCFARMKLSKEVHNLYGGTYSSGVCIHDVSVSDAIREILNSPVVVSTTVDLFS